MTPLEKLEGIIPQRMGFPYGKYVINTNKCIKQVESNLPYILVRSTIPAKEVEKFH